ncbi:lysophosphatidic acid receptor 6-like [Megalops cyprinoides]|uniref:lysophosphatidic acid receptor 6-like n=1 Tax=Megalops cyprinoides TaxID=118141 RepID=UPI0018655BAA|nr:lysophosphatidic acid receptor 6-like [Megalops cyprinoides]
MSDGGDENSTHPFNMTDGGHANVTEGCEGVSADFQYLLLPIVYSLVFVLAMAGNLTALVHFLRTRTVTQPSHIFLVNLCIIDLLFALTLPFNVAYHARHNDWPFGEAMCKVNGALFFGNLYGSSLFLMLISLDRYLAVSHPLRALRLRSPKYRILLSCMVWAILASVILYLTLRGPLTRPFPETGHIACMENFSSKSWRGRISSVSLLAAVIGFFMPLLAIATCYPLIACKLLEQGRGVEDGGGTGAPLSAQHGSGRLRKRALRMVLLVLGVFLLCFAPYHLNQLVHTLGRMGVFAECPLIRFTYPARRVAMALCSLNSCLDPVVYCLASESFRWGQRTSRSRMRGLPLGLGHRRQAGKGTTEVARPEHDTQKGVVLQSIKSPAH